jgi:hypothetical protein
VIICIWFTVKRRVNIQTSLQGRVWILTHPFVNEIKLLEHHSQFFLLVCIGQAFALGIVHMWNIHPCCPFICCLSLYDIFEMSTVVLLIFEACITYLIHVKLIKFDILVYTCIAYGNVKHKKHSQFFLLVCIGQAFALGIVHMWNIHPCCPFICVCGFYVVLVLYFPQDCDFWLATPVNACLYMIYLKCLR